MSCKIIPTVRNSKGELVESALFKALFEKTRNREVTKFLYNLSKSKEFLKTIPNIELDESGELSINSLLEVVDLDSATTIEGRIKQAEKALKTDSKRKDAMSILPDVVRFNEVNDDLIADITKKDNEYIVTVSEVDSNSSKRKISLQKSYDTFRELKAIIEEVSPVDSSKDYSVIHGEFDPTRALETLDDLISSQEAIENGGEIPVNIFHYLVEENSSNPLVQRLINIILQGEDYRNILGDEYDIYEDIYSGNKYKLAREAAGVLLNRYSKDSTDIPSEYSSLIGRTFNKLSSELAKIDNEELRKLKTTTESGELVNAEGSDSDDIERKKLDKINSRSNYLGRILRKSKENKLKRLSMFQYRKQAEKFTQKERQDIKHLNRLIALEEYEIGISEILSETSMWVSRTAKRIKDYKDLIKEGMPAGTLNYIAGKLRDAEDFIGAYSEPLNFIAELDRLSREGELDISPQQARQFSKDAADIKKNIELITKDIISLQKELTIQFFKPFFPQELEIPSGKNKGTKIPLEDILTSSDRDLSIISRFIDSAADSGDIVITLFDAVVKEANNKARRKYTDILHRLIKANNILKNKGIKDTSFMYERDSNGKLTGYIISDRDYGKFNESKKKYAETLKDLPEEEARKLIYKWVEENTELVKIDENRVERMPKKSIYSSDKVNKLNETQKEYYDEYMKIKKEMDSLLPPTVTELYKAPQIRIDTTEAILKEKGGFKKVANKVAKSITDKFIKREDEDEFGYISTNVDFNGEQVERIPIYYTKTLEDLNQLSTDASSSLLAYSVMASKYESMNNILDILEAARTTFKQRRVNKTVGNKTLKEKINVLGEQIEKEVFNTGSLRSIDALNDFFEMQVYSRLKKEEAEVLGKLSVAKTADTLGSITSWTTMGVNIFSGLQNVVIGDIQLLIESIGGEYITAKSLASGKAAYYKMLPEVLADAGNVHKTSKLSLLGERFNVSQELDRELRNKEFYKSRLARILSGGSVYFLMNAGEHYLKYSTLLGMLYNIKVKDSNGKVMPLIDAFTVEKESKDGKVVDARLRIKEGVTDMNGNAVNDDYIDKLSLKIAKVNQSLNGIYNDADKNAIQQYALGRLAFMFRRWMVPHYERRFRKLRYDTQLGQWREGYYITAGRFIYQLGKELTQGKVRTSLLWNSLTSHEKANLRRALTEILTFTAIIGLLSIKGIEDKDTWAKRMMYYHLLRMKREVGASMPTPWMFQDLANILRSPVPAMRTFDIITDTISFWELWEDIERGKYKGHSVYYRNFIKNIPIAGNIQKVIDIKDEDYLINAIGK